MEPIERSSSRVDLAYKGLENANYFFDKVVHVYLKLENNASEK